MVEVAQEVQTPSGSISITGSYDPRFEGVFKEFERNFAERGEVGAGAGRRSFNTAPPGLGGGGGPPHNWWASWRDVGFL